MKPEEAENGELYVVTTKATGDRELYGMRVDSSRVPWMVLHPGDTWHQDKEITIVRRADVQPEPWETLYAASDIYAGEYGYSVVVDGLENLAAKLYNAHQDAQEKAEDQKKREALAGKELAPLRELHTPEDGYYGDLYCAECETLWPCSTARLIYPSEEL